MLERIDAGGPFKYPDDDGETFGNREDLLPDQPMGYYREYTVESAPPRARARAASSPATVASSTGPTTTTTPSPASRGTP